MTAVAWLALLAGVALAVSGFAMVMMLGSLQMKRQAEAELVRVEDDAENDADRVAKAEQETAALVDILDQMGYTVAFAWKDDELSVDVTQRLTADDQPPADKIRLH